MDFQSRLTVAEAAVAFKLPEATISRWHSLGHLKDVTKDRKGRRLFLFYELVEAEHKTRCNGNSSRSLKRRGQQPVAV